MFSTLQLLLLLVTSAYCGKDKPIFSADVQEIINQIHTECVEKTKVAEEDISNCEKGIYKDDEKLKCYVLCLLDEAGLVEDGVIDYDMMISLMPDGQNDRMRNMLKPCYGQDTPDKDPCQRAYDVHKCTYGVDPDFHFIL